MFRPDVLGYSSVAVPDRIAIRQHDRCWTYRQLGYRAARFAEHLRARGLQRGDRVAILSANDIAHFDLLIAAPRAGIVVVPLNTRLSALELQAQVAAVQPSLLLVDDSHAALAALLDVPLLPLAEHEAALVEPPAAPLPPLTSPVGPDDLHLLLFTGGTTGRPKAACLPYRQTLGNADDSARVWDLRPSDRAIQVTPCFHAGAHALSLPLLRAGGTVIIEPRFEPQRYLALAEAERVTWLFMVPTMYFALADAPTFARTDLSSVRVALSGGAPCPASLRDRYAARGIPFRCGFGMTEAGVNCFQGSEISNRDPQNVGRPMPNLAMKIIDPRGLPVPDHAVGELLLAGPQVCAGYWDAPGGGDAFRDGWLRTGDLARRDRDGRYTICGRIKDLMISGGENVYPAEVESALLDLPGVHEACVFGWPDARWGEIVAAAVVLKPGATPDAESLRAALRPRLAGYKVPAAIGFVDALPRSSVGKIVRDEVRALYARLHAPPVRGMRPTPVDPRY